MLFRIQNIVSSFILFLSLFYTQANAQLSQTIRGKVFDKDKQNIIPGVSIVISNSSTGTLSNEQGEFVFKNLPIAKYALVFSIVGYQTKTIQNIELTSAKEVVLEVEMTETPLFLNEVTVKGTQ